MRFVDPPGGNQRRGRGTDWDAIAAACKREPGRWACIGVFRSYNSTKAARTRGLEITTVSVADGLEFYVRWPK
jgi:hypothetical protein